MIAVVLLVSLVVTLILVFYPRESGDQTTTPTNVWTLYGSSVVRTIQLISLLCSVFHRMWTEYSMDVWCCC